MCEQKCQSEKKGMKLWALILEGKYNIKSMCVQILFQ